MDSEPPRRRSLFLLPMPLKTPGETGEQYAIRALKQIAQDRIKAREEREESENPGTRRYPLPRRPASDKG